MACRCCIAAHDNRFNKAVLTDDAFYFSTPGEICGLINQSSSTDKVESWKRANIEKVADIYNQEKIVDSYESMMLSACGQEQPVVRFPVAEAV